REAMACTLVIFDLNGGTPAAPSGPAVETISPTSPLPTEMLIRFERPAPTSAVDGTPASAKIFAMPALTGSQVPPMGPPRTVRVLGLASAVVTAAEIVSSTAATVAIADRRWSLI